MKNPKTLFITHYSSLYGANISLLTFLKNTSIPKNEIIVIAPGKGTFTDELEKSGIKYISQFFPFNTEGKNTSIFTRYWRALKKIRWLLSLLLTVKKIKPKLIYSNSSVIYYGFFISKLLKIPHIWHLREFGSLDYQLLPDFGFSFQKNLLKHNTFNIAISKSISEHYKLNKRNSLIVYNGVISNEQLNTSFKENNFKNSLKFGVVGLISEYKGQLSIVQTFHKYLDTKEQKDDILYIIGNGSGNYFEQIHSYIHKNHLNKNIVITGHISERDNIYNKFDILLNGAIYEGFGRVTAEAMSYGKIPIGYNHSGTAEIIENKVTGLLFNKFEDLPSILKEIDANREKLKQLQLSIKNNFNKEFTIEKYCDIIDNTINTQIAYCGSTYTSKERTINTK